MDNYKNDDEVGHCLGRATYPTSVGDHEGLLDTLLLCTMNCDT